MSGRVGSAGGDRLGPGVEGCLVVLPIVHIDFVMVRLVEQVEPCQGVIALQGGHDLVAVPDIIVERVGAGVEYLAGLFVRGGGAELVRSAWIIFDLALNTGEVQNYPDVIFLSLFEHGIQQTEVLVAMVGPGLVLEVGPPGIRAADSHQVAMVVFKQSKVLIPERLGGGVLESVLCFA